MCRIGWCEEREGERLRARRGQRRRARARACARGRALALSPLWSTVRARSAQTSAVDEARDGVTHERAREHQEVHQPRPSEGACALRDEEEGQLLSRSIAVLLPLPCARALSRARLPPHGAPARDHDPRPTSTGLARARAELVGAGFSRDDLLLHAQQQFSLCSSLWGETPLCASAPG